MSNSYFSFTGGACQFGVASGASSSTTGSGYSTAQSSPTGSGAYGQPSSGQQQAQTPYPAQQQMAAAQAAAAAAAAAAVVAQRQYSNPHAATTYDQQQQQQAAAAVAAATAAYQQSAVVAAAAYQQQQQQQVAQGQSVAVYETAVAKQATGALQQGPSIRSSGGGGGSGSAGGYYPQVTSGHHHTQSSVTNPSSDAVAPQYSGQPLSGSTSTGTPAKAPVGHQATYHQQQMSSATGYPAGQALRTAPSSKNFSAAAYSQQHNEATASYVTGGGVVSGSGPSFQGSAGSTGPHLSNATKAQLSAVNSATNWTTAAAALYAAAAATISPSSGVSATVVSNPAHLQQPIVAQASHQQQQTSQLTALSHSHHQPQHQLQQQHLGSSSCGGVVIGGVNRLGKQASSGLPSAMKPSRLKMPPKPQQLHYCDVCKISCAGPQTYKEHLEGQKHKKKKASLAPLPTDAVVASGSGSADSAAGAATNGSSATPSPAVGNHSSTPGGNKSGRPASHGGTSLRCELCDVTCTGADAYAAHIRGAKHQKVVKLHTKLGKPIPSTDPVILSAGTRIMSAAARKEGHIGNTSQPSGAGIGGSSGEERKLTLQDIVDQDVQPVGQEYIEELRNADGKVISFQCKLCDCKFSDPNAKEMHMKGRRHRLQYKRKVNPDLVVDVKPSMRRNAASARGATGSGGGHPFRGGDYRDDILHAMDWPFNAGPLPMMIDPHGPPGMMMAPLSMLGPWGLPPPPPPMPPRMLMMGPPLRRPDTSDDRHILAKHSKIYPSEIELAHIQRVVGHTERALKGVSDKLAASASEESTMSGGVLRNGDNSCGIKFKDTSTPNKIASEDSIAPAGSAGDSVVSADSKAKAQQLDEKAAIESLTSQNSDKACVPVGLKGLVQGDNDDVPPRQLRGVMRVGSLAKGLLLAGDTEVGLVVLSGDKPTEALLLRVAELLPEQLEKAVASDRPFSHAEVPNFTNAPKASTLDALAASISEENNSTGPSTSSQPSSDGCLKRYTVTADPNEAAIFVRTVDRIPELTVKVTLTSPVMREENDRDDAELATGMLNKTKCLAALADLRHAKWFQVRASSLQSCVILVRIFRDLCRRVPPWSEMPMWPLELLIEKVIASAFMPLHLGDAFRRVFEAISYGILLPGGTLGLHDPCEKTPTDALAPLSLQARENITFSAQHALRLIAFRQIHKVLSMDPLPPITKFNKQNHTYYHYHGHGHFNRKRRLDHSAESGQADGKKDKKDSRGHYSQSGAASKAIGEEASGTLITAALKGVVRSIPNSTAPSGLRTEDSNRESDNSSVLKSVSKTDCDKGAPQEVASDNNDQSNQIATARSSECPLTSNGSN